MRLVVLSDIHVDLTAVEKVLGDILSRDELYVLSTTRYMASEVSAMVIGR